MACPGITLSQYLNDICGLKKKLVCLSWEKKEKKNSVAVGIHTSYKKNKSFQELSLQSASSWIKISFQILCEVQNGIIIFIFQKQKAKMCCVVSFSITYPYQLVGRETVGNTVVCTESHNTENCSTTKLLPTTTDRQLISFNC